MVTQIANAFDTNSLSQGCILPSFSFDGNQDDCKVPGNAGILSARGRLEACEPRGRQDACVPRESLNFDPF